MEAALEARDDGRTRFIGFTGHKSPEIHKKMLDVAAEHDFHFDTVQMPLNVLDAHFNSFEKRVLPIAVREGIGVLGMKPLASGEILKSGAATPIECLHFAMNLPTSVVITGCDSTEILDQALEAARTFKPMTEEEVSALLSRTKNVSADGEYERYKTTMEHDSTSQNPQWLGRVTPTQKSDV